MGTEHVYVKIFLVKWKEIFIYLHPFLFFTSTCFTSSVILETEQNIYFVKDHTQVIINIYPFLFAEQSHFFLSFSFY